MKPYDEKLRMSLSDLQALVALELHLSPCDAIRVQAFGAPVRFPAVVLSCLQNPMEVSRSFFMPLKEDNRLGTNSACSLRRGSAPTKLLARKRVFLVHQGAKHGRAFRVSVQLRFPVHLIPTRLQCPIDRASSMNPSPILPRASSYGSYKNL